MDDTNNAENVDSSSLLVITLKKTFTYEGKDYTTINLSEFEDWSTDELISVKKKFKKMIGGISDPQDVILLEGNDDYIKFLAAEATGLPYDLFGKLPSREFGTIRAATIDFFLG